MLQNLLQLSQPDTEGSELEDLDQETLPPVLSPLICRSTASTMGESQKEGTPCLLAEECWDPRNRSSGEEIDSLQKCQSTTDRDQGLVQEEHIPETLWGGAGSDFSSMHRPDGMVFLVSAIRIQPRHRKMARIQVQGFSRPTLLLLTPGLTDNDLSMVDALVWEGRGLLATVMVENQGPVPVTLEAGT